jgi:hypothetical protein
MLRFTVSSWEELWSYFDAWVRDFLAHDCGVRGPIASAPYGNGRAYFANGVDLAVVGVTSCGR